MIKNILILVIVIVAVAVGIWFFLRKDNSKSSSLYGSNSPVASASAEFSPGASAQATPVASPAGKLTKLQDGLEYQDITLGTGQEVKSGDKVSVNYTGMLQDGTVFDSNVDPKFGHVQPFSFTIGQQQVIPGWEEGLVGMKVGGTRQLLIPPSLGYGAQANGPIPANSTLIFQVQVTSVGQ